MIKIHRSLLHEMGHHHSVPALRTALQQAIALEHSTIPLYLYALYSLSDERHANAAKIVRSIVVEEMLHMVLAANVLNAIGGSPVLNDASFIPHYPGHLPAKVDRQVEVHLRPLSREQLAQFIEIEEPRDPIGYLSPTTDSAVETCTIGEFYLAIEQAIAKLPEAAFVAGPHHQVGPDLMYGSITVFDRASASEAIETIIEQGEGTSASPVEIDGPGGVNDFAHHYRLTEIQKGRKLIRVSDDEEVPARYAYEGDVVEFDSATVAAMPTNPRSVDFEPGTVARYLIDSFNYNYSQLLATLHQLVNGRADQETFGASLQLMYSLARRAKVLVAGELTNGLHLGPTFEFLANQPVPPKGFDSELATK